MLYLYSTITHSEYSFAESNHDMSAKEERPLALLLGSDYADNYEQVFYLCILSSKHCNFLVSDRSYIL